MRSYSPALPLDDLLSASSAAPEFHADVHAYARFAPSSRVSASDRAPRVKVLRVLAQLLASEPELRIEAVHVMGVAGCCDFRGAVTATVDGVERTWEFVWDCRWRARESGIVDAGGYPDQARAAREFGWQCFSTWRERAANVHEALRVS